MAKFKKNFDLLAHIMLILQEMMGYLLDMSVSW